MHELFEILQHHADAFGDRPGFDDGTLRLAYAPLARRVAATAEDVRALPCSQPVIGILGGNRVDVIVGQLAGWHAGRIVVPLPPYFRTAQLRHVVGDAGISHVLAAPDMAETARDLGVPFTVIGNREASFAPPAGDAGGQIIYTSGSTGQPKGVLLGGGQLMWSARALARATGARDADSYLSVLPLALLLETISAVIIPILVGAPVRLEPALADLFSEADGSSLAGAVARHRPTCMVLVPHLLARWVAALRETGENAPASLRFVAVGGAAVPPALAEEAWILGIPVHEGYGLSECGSVVTLNRPGERRAGTVGRPLPGLDVRVDQGEIVVSGPSVMDHYLHGAAREGAWRTGDLGEIDAEGYLQVRGRLDNLIVTPMGRNISPEWIESLITADPRIAHCVVTHFRGPHLTAILVPTARGEDWFRQASLEDIGALFAECCRDVPAYAVPRQFIVVTAAEMSGIGLSTGAGPMHRRAILETCAVALGAHGVVPDDMARRVFG